MLLLSFGIGKNYAFELSGFKKIRESKDGISFFKLELNLDRYEADHNPKFSASLMIWNVMILELEVYSVHHVTQ